MLEITIKVSGTVEEVPGVKELLCMALEGVPGARVAEVVKVCVLES